MKPRRHGEINMAKKLPKTVEEKKQVEVPKLNLKRSKITIVGQSPLMVNNFAQKSKVEMLEKHLKKAKGPREARDVRGEVEAALYKLPNGKYGIPASGIKNCAVSACRFIEGVAMTRAKGAFFVIEDANGLVQIDSKKYEIDERPVSIGTFGNKKKMIRFRPRFDEWSCTFEVLYNPDILSADQLVNLFNHAGFSVGLCEYRPERSGSYGMFKVR